MAQALEISQTHMSNIESGRVQIKLRLLLRAANFFIVSWMIFLKSKIFLEAKGMGQ